jgi:hypothetical protein
MSLASWFYGIKAPVRDYITHFTIREGTILIVYPAERSHVSKPYKVKVVYLCKEYFKTCMLDGSGHIAVFTFDSDVWKDYHCTRFKIYVF